MSEFPYTIIYGEPHVLWRTEGYKLAEKILSSRNKVAVEDKFNRLHIEHYGSPANYSEGIFPHQQIKKMDVPWDMIHFVKVGSKQSNQTQELEVANDK